MKRLFLVATLLFFVWLATSLSISDRNGTGIIHINEVQTFYRLPETMPYDDYIYLKSIGVNMPYVDVQGDKVEFSTTSAESDNLIPDFQKYGMKYDTQQAKMSDGMVAFFGLMIIVCGAGVALPIAILWEQRKQPINFRQFFTLSTP